jgi:hypothetical protein
MVRDPDPIDARGLEDVLDPLQQTGYNMHMVVAF